MPTYVVLDACCVDWEKNEGHPSSLHKERNMLMEEQR